MVDHDLLFLYRRHRVLRKRRGQRQSDLHDRRYCRPAILYGANFNTYAGNTVYTWSPTTGETFIDGVGQGASSANKVYEAIWDGGGIDTYNLSNYSTNLFVDLTPGDWSIFSTAQLADLDGLGTHLAAGNVANAYLYNDDPRSLIENAVGGSGNDILLGNQANNMLSGGAGNDILASTDGNDTLSGATGNDTLDGGWAMTSWMGAPPEAIRLPIWMLSAG